MNLSAGLGPQAISKPSIQTENEAWNAVLPQVGILKGFYEYAGQIGTSGAMRKRRRVRT